MGFKDWFSLLWNPVKDENTSYFDALIIGFATAIVVALPILFLAGNFVEIILVFTPLYFSMRFPKTTRKLFKIQPNEHEKDDV